MRMDMSQGPFCVEIYRENAGRLSRAHYFARRAQSKCTCTLTLYGDQKQNQHMATEYGNPSFCLGSGWRAGKLSSQLATPLLTASLAALLSISLAPTPAAPTFCNNIVCAIALPYTGCLTRVPYLVRTRAQELFVMTACSAGVSKCKGTMSYLPSFVMTA